MQLTQVVIVGLDGLRADMMTPDTTPCCVSPSRASSSQAFKAVMRKRELVVEAR